MFSVVASDILAVADAATLKHAHLTLPSLITLTEECHTSAWAADNSALYLSSSQTIFRYDPSSNQVKTLHALNDGCSLRCMVTKDKSTVIYGSGPSIHILECGGQTPKVVQSLGPHKQDILSLSLSNDSNLLACGVSNAAYVHNLTSGVQITLRGLPSTSSSTLLCVFHAHIRTRLLVGHLNQLFLYDTTRPSAPMKVIQMNNAGASISAIACSPFSKTLIAVAMSNGSVGLVDLDKEKALFRVLNLNVPLTSIAFSPEGASIYLGTDNGKILIQDLRTLDKAPRSVTISQWGKPISALAVQKKLKSTPDDVKTKGTSKSLSASTSISAATISPIRTRTTRLSALAASTPVRSAPVKSTTPKETPLPKAVNPKKVLSPSRDPHGNSPRLGSGEMAKPRNPQVKKAHLLSNASFSSTPKGSPAKTVLPSRKVRRTSAPTSAQTRKQSTAADLVEASITTQLNTTATEPLSSISSIKSRSHSRKALPDSLPPSVSEPAVPRISRMTSSASLSSATSRHKVSPPAPAPPVPSISPEFIANLHSVPSVFKSDDENRTPSPELPTMKTDVMTPIPARRKTKAMAVLGLGTPEVTAWIKAGKGQKVQQQNGSIGPKGKGRVKSVGFKNSNARDPSSPVQIRVQGKDFLKPGGGDQESQRERSLSLQISPRRPPLPTSSSNAQSHGQSQSWDASPVPRSRHTSQIPSATSAGSAHELLRTIVKDVMYDFQQETKAEMMGLHLDLVRMGRGWKQDLRKLMEEYVGDLNDLREENKSLRAENDRLKRRY